MLKLGTKRLEEAHQGQGSHLLEANILKQNLKNILPIILFGIFFNRTPPPNYYSSHIIAVLIQKE